MKFIPVYEKPLCLNYFNSVPIEKDLLVESLFFDEYPNVYLDIYSTHRYGIRAKEINLNSNKLGQSFDVVFRWGNVDIGINNNGQVFLEANEISIGDGNDAVLSVRMDITMRKGLSHE
ncbi:TPA: hypothetical protein ACX6SR_003866 [Photobacterium damselae]